MIDIKLLKGLLEEKVRTCEKVIIVPHNRADFDAIGAAIGISLIPRKLKKPSYIVVNDSLQSLYPGVKQIIDESKKEFDIINAEKYKAMANANDLIVMTDVNKTYLISIADLLTNPDNIIIIDHHDSDDKTVNAANQFIDTEYSSASEIVTLLLSELKIKIPANVATYLYSGIYLDTDKLAKNYSSRTLRIAADLVDYGVKSSHIDELFKEDFLSYRKVQELISRTQMINCMIAFVVASEDEEYSQEEIAKAADNALKFGADAAFAIGKTEGGVVSISGRSTERINVGNIMSQFENGGGNLHAAAARIVASSNEEAEMQLKRILTPNYFVQK